MAVRFLGIGRARANAKERRQDATQERDSAQQGYSNILSSLKDRMAGADQRAGMSVRDLYGSSIDRRTDNIRSNANATKSMLSRIQAARGGDVTGGANTAVSKIDQRANENIGDTINYYTDRASTDREQAQARGDRIANAIMSGQGNLLQMSEGRLQQEISRELQRRQANKQLGVDIFSTLASTGASALAGG